MSAGKRSIAVVGSINRDTIRTADGVRTDSYGGILYSVLALAALSDATIYPVCNIGADVESPVREILCGEPGVRWDGVRVVPDRNPHCILDYDAAGRKQETLYGGVPALTTDRVVPFLDCDALCLNFITGQELALATLQDVKTRAILPVFMDLHSLSLASDRNHRRYLRRPERWLDWVAGADFVQMNETEAALLADAGHVDEATALQLAQRILAVGPQGVVVTRGPEGTWTCRPGNCRGIRFTACCLPPPGPVVDETGCGDVFLMGFAWAYLNTGDVDCASRYANLAAGANCCLRGIEEIGRISGLIPAAERI